MPDKLKEVLRFAARNWRLPDEIEREAVLHQLSHGGDR
jgi:hypothetical protein